MVMNLTFGYNFNQSIDNLSNSITNVEFDYYLNNPIKYISNSIIHLKFGNYFNQSITNLNFSSESNFNQMILRLESNLIHLELGKNITDKKCNIIE